MNAAEPSETSVFVRKPACFCRHWRSKPISAPSPIAKSSRSVKSMSAMAVSLCGYGFSKRYAKVNGKRETGC
jgi:hypothetical protein